MGCACVNEFIYIPLAVNVYLQDEAANFVKVPNHEPDRAFMVNLSNIFSVFFASSLTRSVYLALLRVLINHSTCLCDLSMFIYFVSVL